ncbi:MAG: helix-turn-helix transcriptional regulator [Chloroflexota bacterium]
MILTHCLSLTKINMFTREDLLRSKEYWLGSIQIDLFNLVEDYLKEKGMNRTQFAEKLGVTKGYVSQVLNGDFNHRISKMVELALAIGKAPKIEFVDLDKYMMADKYDITDYDEEQQISFYKNLKKFKDQEDIQKIEAAFGISLDKEKMPTLHSNGKIEQTKHA